MRQPKLVTDLIADTQERVGNKCHVEVANEDGQWFLRVCGADHHRAHCFMCLNEITGEEHPHVELSRDKHRVEVCTCEKCHIGVHENQPKQEYLN